MGTTVAGVLAGETPYLPHLYKRNEIGVIISYALITLKTCIPMDCKPIILVQSPNSILYVNEQQMH